MTKLFQWFLQLSRPNKRVFSVLVDIIMLFIACWSAVALSLGTYKGILDSYWIICLLAPVCAIPVMIPMGLYRAVIRYVGYRAIWTVVRAVSIGVVVWGVTLTLADLFVLLPYSSIIIFWMAALVMIGGTRILGRWMFRQYTPVGRSYKNRHACRALIYGAGAAGQQMATALLISPEVSPVGFLDDDRSVYGSEIAGLRVYGLGDIEDLIRRYDVDTVLMAIRSLSTKRRREIIRKLEQYPVEVKIMPPLGDLAKGQIQLNDMSNVDVVDLLGRDSVKPDDALLERCIKGKSVLVTGAGGSIGSELCRQILQQKPALLILFELSEYALYVIEKELSENISANQLDVLVYPMLGTVQDQKHLEDIMRKYSVETVYHAAAYKHVPLVEHNIVSGIRNNLFGTIKTAEAAIATGVKNFVLISSDKAVRPTNIMGATKRMAEMSLQAISHREASAGNKVCFSMVRFGNVLGSSGSVIPLFRQQIARGGPVTVTHEKMTRYFMTIPEAASLVIQAGAMGHTGDVFLLDMGESVKIVDLAKEMIVLAGYSVRDETHPEGEIEIVFSGLRPGEKLFEELLIGGNAQGTDHPMILRSSEAFLEWTEMSAELVDMEALLQSGDYLQISGKLKKLVSGYEPLTGIEDYLYNGTAGVPSVDIIRH